MDPALGYFWKGAVRLTQKKIGDMIIFFLLAVFLLKMQIPDQSK